MKSESRLKAMMFLEYAVKGLWFPLASVFLTASAAEGGLGFTQQQKGWIIGIPLAVGAFFAPVIGRLCDRKFAAQKCLGFLLVCVGILKLVTAWQSSFLGWLCLSAVFSVFYVPTIALTNTLAMSHLKNPKEAFPRIRVWGTLGWSAVAWVFPMIWLQENLHFRLLPPFLVGDSVANAPGRMIDSVRVAGVLSILYGLFCIFCLPHTPPKKEGGEALRLTQAFSLFRKRSFTVLMLAALFISIIHTIYFMQTGAFLVSAGLKSQYIMPAMSIGQFSEILMLAVLGKLLTRFGFRPILLVGAGCFVLRYILFSMVQLPVAAFVAAQALHGICFACFYATAFIYVDRLADEGIRHSAQTLFTLVMMGVAPLLAGLLNSRLASMLTGEGLTMGLADYGGYWRGTALIGVVAFLILAALFRDETESSES